MLRIFYVVNDIVFDKQLQLMSMPFYDSSNLKEEILANLKNGSKFWETSTLKCFWTQQEHA